MPQPAPPPANPPRRLPAAIWALGFVSLLMDISSEMIHSLLPVFMVTVLGTSLWAVGLIEGLAEATALIVKVFSGVLSDYWGKRKPLALLGYGLGAASKPLFALAATTGLVLGARLLDRVGKGLRGAPRDAMSLRSASPCTNTSRPRSSCLRTARRISACIFSAYCDLPISPRLKAARAARIPAVCGNDPIEVVGNSGKAKRLRCNCWRRLKGEGRWSAPALARASRAATVTLCTRGLLRRA